MKNYVFIFLSAMFALASCDSSQTSELKSKNEKQTSASDKEKCPETKILIFNPIDVNATPIEEKSKQPGDGNLLYQTVSATIYFTAPTGEEYPAYISAMTSEDKVSDPESEVVAAKNAYSMITTLPFNQILVEVSGEYDITITKIPKPTKKKVGNATLLSGEEKVLLINSICNVSYD